MTRQLSRPDAWSELRALTDARIALGRAGASLPTSQVLDFAIAHADARDAVHAELDLNELEGSLRDLGIGCVKLATRAEDRQEYLASPCLGRQLDDASRATLSGEKLANCDVAMILADGLSAPAAMRQGPAVLKELLARLAEARVRVAPICLVRHARVAIEDEIGAMRGAKVAVILLGERPGLVCAESLGAYLVYDPRPGRTDAQRNCVSNIRPGGLSAAAAAHTLSYLITESLRRQLSGVELKDDRSAMLANGGCAPMAEQRLK